jgi:hypothetical protein
MASIFDFIGVDPRSMQQAPRPVTAAIAPTMYDDAIMRRTRSPLPRQMQASMPMPTVLPQSKPAMMPSPYDDAVMRQARNPAPTLLQAAPQPQAEQPAATPAETGGFGGLLGTSFNDPRTQGILAASASLLESGGNRTGAPVGIGQALGRALKAGTAGYSGAQSAEAARKDAEINQQYKLAQAKQMESSATRPILTDLGNGAFTRVTDPVTGESKIVKNNDVKEYLERQATKKQTKNINLSDKQIEAQTDELDNIAATTDLLSDTDEFLDMMTPDSETGELQLEFGALDRMGDAIALSTGIGNTQEARNSASFDRYISRLRNELLRMAKGVQTDGDAQRAIDEIVSATESRDTEAVRQAMEDLRVVQKRTIQRYKAKIQNRRKAKNMDAFDFGNEATADGVGYSVVEDDD